MCAKKSELRLLSFSVSMLSLRVVTSIPRVLIIVLTFSSWRENYKTFGFETSYAMSSISLLCYV